MPACTGNMPLHNRQVHPWLARHVARTVQHDGDVKPAAELAGSGNGALIPPVNQRHALRGHADCGQWRLRHGSSSNQRGNLGVASAASDDQPAVSRIFT